MSTLGELTLLLQKAQQGDVQASDDLFRMVEQDLRAIAKKRQQRICQDITLTGLIDQAFCKVVGNSATRWQAGARRKFFVYAATKIHNILVNNLRRTRTRKHGGTMNRADLDVDNLPNQDQGTEFRTLFVDLETALNDVPPSAQQAAEIFRIRFFLGCTVSETADIMGLSEKNVKRGSQRIRSWLQWKMKAYRRDESDCSLRDNLEPFSHE